MPNTTDIKKKGPILYPILLFENNSSNVSCTLHISHAGGAEPTLINVQFSMLSIIDRPIMGHGS